ncbi:hypothetical protein MYX65_07420 [Acidobacteria bacterium AH-259-L09]|nr:hypothetical protein [Acidobacteria bacterium AH-259-L09]
MPTFDEHIAKARHNEEFIVEIRASGNKFLDWAITGYFYAAIHYVESYFARFLGYHTTDHGERLTRINHEPSLREVYPVFRSLKDDSEEARYGVTEFTDEVVETEIKPRLEKIKSHLKSKSIDYRDI